ncbi:hypothetical protein TSIB_1502 [Thermococcus sibiricus MM 739]|uniref:Uncharacterized protein n=1 Tax=Thermococcus sibiricus (strain DSM 12597 / MM 739) TaxID=604354 RepID=C6A4K8_THESM|nr:hypothetical protein TSIB_1502 [Thermococcus sibiricus MM 739]
MIGDDEMFEGLRKFWIGEKKPELKKEYAKCEVINFQRRII